MSRGSKEEIFGERVFRGVSTFFGDVVFKKHMTLYAPIPSEPSLGTPHPVAYANRVVTRLVDTSTNTGGTWSAAVSAPASAPAGAKTMFCWAGVTVAGFCILCVEQASGVTLDNITGSYVWSKYQGVGNPMVSGVSAAGIIRIPLDSNKQFKWCTYTTNSTVLIGSPIGYEM